MMERLGGGSPGAYEDVHVCAECFEDEALKAFVEGEASSKSCDFCGANSENPIATPMVEILLCIKEGLDREYNITKNIL